MKKHVTLLFTFLALLFSSTTAQRGNPPREKTSTRHVTKYPQHMDFLPFMVKALDVPDGWEVSVAAYGLGKPRMMCTGPNGELFVTRRDGGDVLMLKDKDGDGKLEELVTVAADFKGVHGITIHDGWMYLCNNNQLRRYRMKKDGTLEKNFDVLISDLPDGGQHPNRTIDFGPDGMLYISVGTLCNDCKESDNETACILQVNPADWSRTIYATGLRNTIGFDWHPTTGEMWGADNGGDAKGNRWPPEEINHIKQGGLYGYPFAYGNREVDDTREDPAGNTKEAWVLNTEPSILELPAHMAPIAFQFFGNASNIPVEYSGDALVAWHGSWNRSHPVGFKVQRIHFENGVAKNSDDFLKGFLKPGFPLFKRKARFGRPAGITITPGGIVYVSDDANGVIYAVQQKK